MGLLAAFTHTLEITLPVFLMVFLGLSFLLTCSIQRQSKHVN